MLAKDHDVHPLHVMAANLAKVATADVARAMNDNWLNRSPADKPIETALQYLVHPATLRARDGAPQNPLRGGAKRVWDVMKGAASDPNNQPRIKKVEGRNWLKEQLENAKKEQEEIRKRAKQIDLKKTQEEIEEWLRRLEELRKPPVPVS
jgi:hypothetical protein